MAEPEGLGLSLDDLINKQKRDQEQGYGKQRRQSGGRGGRGGRGEGRPGRGRGYEHQPYERQVSGRGVGRGYQGGGAGQGGGPYGGGGGPIVVVGGGQWGDQRQQQPRYNLRHEQQQQQQPQIDPTQYRQHQSCWQEESGEVVFRFMRTDLVRIDTAGNITLDSGGHWNGVTLASLNDALNLIGIRVTCPSGDVHVGEWSISDGRSLTRFVDGVVLPAKGPQQAGRGRQLLTAFNSPNHAAAAAAGAASNAAAAQAGIIAFTGFIPPGVPAGRPVMLGGGGGGRGSVFARLGGGQQQQEERYAPY